jgi:hypothetical protein
MRLNSFKIFAALLLASGTMQAQELYMPRNVKEAYANGTRSFDGKPGKAYWQNRGKYDMNITVTPETRLVSGSESILYTNNSKDTLKALVIRFVNNVHKTESPRASAANKDFLTTGLAITAFSVNGTKYDINAKNWGTTGQVRLKSDLLPGQTANVAIDWNYPLSKEGEREGQIDSSTFFVAYSYPRISVYDDYNGWDRLPHMGRNEFYNDFNDYKLAVKAPKNYVVWATGDLLNPDEVLQPGVSAKLKKSYVSDEVSAIATPAEMKAGKITQQKAWNTWRFAADNISDVTFAVSDHYAWDAGSVVVDKKTNRRTSVQAAYSETAKDFPHAVEWSKKALAWFSNNLPGVAYPFSKMTAVQGYADMEYPMMVNDTATPDLPFSQFVMNHEIVHTWFPFYMGINETNYAFMDEGWATTFEYFIGTEQGGKDAADKMYKEFRVKRWIFDPSTEEDQPVISLGTQLSGAGYGNNAYVKPSLAYMALKDMLGDEAFKKALHEYMDRWNGKHPIPWDFFYSINDATNQDLNWFWNNWFFSNNYIDLAIEKVSIKGSKYAVDIKNVGGFAVPVDMKITYADGKEELVHKTAAIWKSNQKQTTVEINGGGKIQSIVLDGGIFMDAKPLNNNWKL